MGPNDAERIVIKSFAIKVHSMLQLTRHNLNNHTRAIYNICLDVSDVLFFKNNIWFFIYVFHFFVLINISDFMLCQIVLKFKNHV